MKQWVGRLLLPALILAGSLAAKAHEGGAVFTCSWTTTETGSLACRVYLPTFAMRHLAGLCKDPSATNDVERLKVVLSGVNPMEALNTTVRPTLKSAWAGEDVVAANLPSGPDAAEDGILEVEYPLPGEALQAQLEWTLFPGRYPGINHEHDHGELEHGEEEHDCATECGDGRENWSVAAMFMESSIHPLHFFTRDQPRVHLIRTSATTPWIKKESPPPR